MAMASHVGFIRSCVSAVFLHIGQRESCPASWRKQCQCMAWPHGSSWLASRDEKRSSWHTGQLRFWREGVRPDDVNWIATSSIVTHLDMYFPTLQL